MKPGDVIEFDRIREFRHIKALGSGGTGDAHLFKDDTTDMLFAIKKYVPKDTKYVHDHYDRFVDEIKILFKIMHPNIVRIYNYYLYPEQNLGYLQMEYIDGVDISSYDPTMYSKDWDSIFSELISAFLYLESQNILHRDVREENIMIDIYENVKLIDFGFGKQLMEHNLEGRSVLLNWPVSQLPLETANEGIYNHQTEIYFVGKLFKKVLRDEYEDFKFNYIIEKMIKLDPSDRYVSFIDISNEISLGVIGEIGFSTEEKEIYRVFAETLSQCIANFNSKYESIRNPSIVQNKLSSLIRSSSLEKVIQDNAKLINCFVSISYTYYSHVQVEVEIVINFYRLLQKLDTHQQKIVLDNIDTRLSKIQIINEDDDLPF